eukprot:704152-Alexandrium_andersonii.AAC.1
MDGAASPRRAMPCHVVVLPRALGAARRPLVRPKDDRPRRLLQRRQPENPAPRRAREACASGVDA